MTTHKVYVDIESLSKEELEQLLIDKEQENQTLKEDNQTLKEDNDKLQTGPYKYSYIKKLQYQNKKLELENKILKKNGQALFTLEKRIDELLEENKRLKEVYEACNLDSINKAFKISNLEMENKKLEKKILKLGTRICQNIDGKKREEYQEYCKRNKL